MVAEFWARFGDDYVSSTFRELMKKIKISYMGKHLKDIYPHATRFQVLRYKFNKLMEKVVLASFILGMIYGAFQVGKYTTESKVTHANIEVEKIIEVESKKIPPVLQRIAKCESGNTHFDSNGQVLMRSNTNRTVDVGRYQLNSVWFKKATELGLDITKEKDNEKMAVWIYENRGTGDWYSSANCWN